MKQTIDGVVYDTDTSTLIAKSPGWLQIARSCNVFRDVHLYEREDGTLFAHQAVIDGRCDENGIFEIEI